MELNAYEELNKHLKKVAVHSIPSKKYLHLRSLADKYRKLGFEFKVSQIRDEMKEIQPAPRSNFLWITINVEKLWISRPSRSRGDYEEFYGVLFDQDKEERKALLLIPCGRWVGDIPEAVLDHALLMKHNFQSLYVAPVVSGRRDERDKDIDLITPDLGNIVENRLDPLLLGSLRSNVNTKGLANFAVLGVWGTDWFDLKLPELRLNGK